MKILILLLLLSQLFFACQKTDNLRKVSSLNGEWEIAKTVSIDVVPDNFDSKVVVPGLVDMAKPAVDEQDTAYNNSIYWYKRNFTIDDLDAEIIQLKINKAKYHSRIYINGKFAGENVYNFVPMVFNIKEFLNEDGRENELIVAVGCSNDLPDTVTNGGDFEKTKYIPGIYDDVKITTTSLPFISNVQTVPDIENQKLRVVAEILASEDSKTKIEYVISEAVSGKEITKGDLSLSKVENEGLQKLDFTADMSGCNLWSPESPFLYDLEIKTSGDNTNTRFGMRTFSASRDSGVFLLNGKPYYMRGTNVCIFRFFEDPDRNGLPWDRIWSATLHDRFKDMNWNSIRYCIGFPPESWYEIADSAGFLIQDEYPIWTGGKGGFEKLLGGITSDQLADEYRQWMRERWNHASVVVWDAQNESVNDTTAKAIQMVRSLDLSDRPWDNGWAAPASERDAIEAHPYLFSKYMRDKPGEEGYLKELLTEIRIPGNGPDAHSPSSDGTRYKNPIILNEYGWIWLNRNGSTTTLTDYVYPNVFPEADTPEKRLEVYAKNLAVLTEYWRVSRNAGAVMHFCGLGYSRPEEPRGQTSDNFTDILNLVYEPHFYKHMKPAFSPLALMIEYWEKDFPPKSGDVLDEVITIPIHLINDNYESVEDSVRFRLYSGEELIYSTATSYQLQGLGKSTVNFSLSVPEIKSSVTRMEAEIMYNGEAVTSVREFSLSHL